MPEKNIPPEWWVFALSLLWTSLAGAAGALVRQINGPRRAWAQRISEWIAGAICAAYGTETMARLLMGLLNKFDLLDQSASLTPESVAGLSGFLCGAFGITVIDCAIGFIRKKFGYTK